MLTLSMLRQLFEETVGNVTSNDPRKLLGFTDNRQDAALQAGHFNDFIFLLILRSGLIGALRQNSNVLQEDRLSEAVFDSLGFGQSDPGILAEYLRDPVSLVWVSGRPKKPFALCLVTDSFAICEKAGGTTTPTWTSWAC